MKTAKRGPAGQTVTTYGFNVPCRRFLLTANVTRDRRLPVVDEFVLRILKITDRLPAAKLGAFFGFTAGETTTVLADLQVRGLISIVDNDVELTPSSHEHFRLGRDGAPEIVQVETWVNRLWFDLISRNMMTPERTRPLDNLLTLKAAASSKEVPISFAREAFEQNFFEFLTKVRRINNPDVFSLYSVSEVVPDRFGSIVLSGLVELQLDPEPRLVQRLLEVDAEDPVRYRPLLVAMQDAIRRLTEADPSLAGFAEFRRFTGDATAFSNYESKEYFSPTKWLTTTDGRSTRDRLPIVGASYLQRNIAVFTRFIEQRSASRLKAQAPRALRLRYYRPVGSAWGATQEIQRLVPEVTASIKKTLSPAWRVNSTLIAPASARKETTTRFARLFDFGLASPAGHLAAGTEIISLEGIAALVLTRVALSPVISIPVGFALSGQADLQRLENALLAITPEKDYEPLWSRSARHDAMASEDISPESPGEGVAQGF